MKNRLEKIFSDLMKDTKSVAAFSPSRQFRVRRNDVTHHLAAKYSFKIAASEVHGENFSRIACTSKAETSISRTES